MNIELNLNNLQPCCGPKIPFIINISVIIGSRCVPKIILNSQQSDEVCTLKIPIDDFDYCLKSCTTMTRNILYLFFKLKINNYIVLTRGSIKNVLKCNKIK